MYEYINCIVFNDIFKIKFESRFNFDAKIEGLLQIISKLICYRSRWDLALFFSKQKNGSDYV